MIDFKVNTDLVHLETKFNDLKEKIIDKEIDNIDILLDDIKSTITIIIDIRKTNCFADRLNAYFESTLYALNKGLLDKNINIIKYDGLALLEVLIFAIVKLENGLEKGKNLSLEQKNYLFNELAPKYGKNHFTCKSERDGKFKYDVSLIILGYNKADYSKQCIESLLKYLPKDYTYELVLLNHGSTDETEKLFNSIKTANKVVNIKANGPGFETIYKLSEGEHTLIISNDVLITENAIDNMLKCIKSDPTFTMVVPYTPNVSNLQAYSKPFKTLDEMYSFASEFNKSNQLMWEEKSLLINPLHLFNSSQVFGENGCFYNSKNLGFDIAFPDDLMAYVIRDFGGKLILAKDTYCYHFGSVTVKSELASQQNFYLNERINYFKAYKYNPWDSTVRVNAKLIYMLELNKKEDVSILNIHSSNGANLLALKSKLIEYNDQIEVKSFSINDERIFDNITKNTSDEYLNINNCFDIQIYENLAKQNKMFDYIIVEQNPQDYENLEYFFELILKLLKPTGVISFTNYTETTKIALKSLSDLVEEDEQVLFYRNEFIKPKKILIPSTFYNWSSESIFDLNEIFVLLDNNNFDITLDVSLENYFETIISIKSVFTNDITFYKYLNSNSNLIKYFSSKKNILLIDNDNMDLINIDLIKSSLNIQLLPSTKEIEQKLINLFGLSHTIKYFDDYQDDEVMNVISSYYRYYHDYEL